VLSSPRIATLNNQKAVLKIGTDEFYVTGVTTTTNSTTAGNTITPSVTLQPFFSGVVLDVTPQIDDKGNILLHVHPSVSQVTTVTKGINLGTAGNLSLPLAASSTSEIDSMVRGQDGRVVAIGGLMRQATTGDVSQVPGAGKIPVLGALFRNKARASQKRELVVLIKPTIVDGAGAWNQDLLDTSRRMMYSAHFGLRELPFSITPDTSYFFGSPHSQEALNTLLVAARNGEGFIKITGEVGTGKTLLCRKFMGTLGDGFVTAYIPNPYLEPRTLMLALADELEITLEKDVDQHQLLKSITHRLVQLASQDKRVLLCLDEAQAIPVESLEALRLLTNLETEKRKLLQIVLFGQPELNRKLALDSIRQLAQRITFHYHLGPLTKDDLEYYLAHRLRVAGFTGARLFSRGAVAKLFGASGGIPRLVNILSHKALMLSYGQGKQQVTRAHVQEAARDTLAAPRRFWPWLAGSGLLAAAGGLAWALTR
jgi:MSHA biogenesis protein MshM